jgi:hypothetical protein
MRINDRLVVQLVDADVVFIDDVTGDEHTISGRDIPALARRLTERQSMDFDDLGEDEYGVVILRDEFPGVAFALGYFWATVNR